MKKKVYTRDDLKQMDYQITREEGPDELTDEFGNVFNVDEVIEQAEKDIESTKPIKLTLRWNKRQLDRFKKIAALKGIKNYQTYMKKLIDQIIEAEEKKLGIK